MRKSHNELDGRFTKEMNDIRFTVSYVLNCQMLFKASHSVKSLGLANAFQAIFLDGGNTILSLSCYSRESAMGHAEFCRQTWLSLSSLFPTGIELIFQRFPGDREFLLRELPVGSMLLVGDRYAQGNPQWRHSRRLDPDHSLCNLLFLWQVL